MRLVEHPRRPGEVDLPLVFLGVVLVAGLLAAGWQAWGPGFPPCALKAATGIPCPTCGGTRMAQALVGGHLVQALRWNPLILLSLSLVFGAGVVCGLRRLLGLPRVRLELDRPWERRSARLAVLVLLAAGWAWLLLSGV